MATIVTRSGKGSPLTNTEVDANFTNLNTDKLETSGGTLTGDLSFGDNDKAIFGAGSDLQIYHDATSNATFIQESGAGNLIIDSSNLNMRNAAGTQSYLNATDGAGVTLRYAGGSKLATTSTGIDVTGTVIADNVALNSSFENWSVNGVAQLRRVGLAGGADAAGGNLSWNAYYDGGWKYIDSLDATRLQFVNNDFKFYTAPTGTADNAISFTERMQINGNGDISFYEDTGTTPKFFWDASAESLGLGTASPSSPLHISLPSSGTDVEGWRVSSGGGGLLYVRVDNAASANPTWEMNVAAGEQLAFGIGASEAMRIDSSGNLLIGTTDTSPWNNISGTGIAALASGVLASTASGDAAFYGNRLGSDGDIIQLRKDGTTVGSIGNLSTTMYIGGNGQCGVMFNGANYNPTSTGGTRSDGTVSLGVGAYRYKDLYLSGGVYLGGTTSANYLDDYEEGSWTPTALAGVTGFTVSAAKYVKIGRTVTVTMYLASFSGASSAALSIGGLPFTVLGSTYHTGSFETGSAGKMGMFRAQSGGSNFIAYYPDTSTAVRTSFAGNDIGSQLIGSFTYMTS